MSDKQNYNSNSSYNNSTKKPGTGKECDGGDCKDNKSGSHGVKGADNCRN